MASFSELANLRPDVVAKVEDSKEARPGLGHRLIANPGYVDIWISPQAATHGSDGGRASASKLGAC